MRSAPTARLVLDEQGTELTLRIVDVSIGGCAMFLPDDLAPPQPGLRVTRAEVDLDADTRFKVDMRLQHVTLIHTEARGVRLGFEFLRASGESLRALQRFIDQTQKRGKLLALD
jgi:c-di-GMP-binding flagellar brake protein YcgR